VSTIHHVCITAQHCHANGPQKAGPQAAPARHVPVVLLLHVLSCMDETLFSGNDLLTVVQTANDPF